MLPYQKRKLKVLAEVEELVTLALAKMNKFPGMYIGDLRDLRDIVGIKLKLEQLQRRVSAGRQWELRRELHKQSVIDKLKESRNERSSTRATTKE